jgi:hypothetical protein
MQTESRRHLRAKIILPVLLMTPYSLLEAEIINLSLGGALIQFTEKIKLGNGFPVVGVGKYYSLWIRMKSKGFQNESRLVSALAKVIWANTGNFDSGKNLRKLGVHFIRSSVSDAQSIIKIISQYI